MKIFISKSGILSSIPRSVIGGRVLGALFLQNLNSNSKGIIVWIFMLVKYLNQGVKLPKASQFREKVKIGKWFWLFHTYVYIQLSLVCKQKKYLNTHPKMVNQCQISWQLIDNDHRLLYALATRITFICPMKFNAFPMDIHRCLFQVGSFNYDTEKMVFRSEFVPDEKESIKSILDYSISCSHRNDF